MIALSISSITLFLFAFSFIYTNKIQNANIKQQQNAINYICSTTTVLDELVVSGANSIQENFDNGTYQKLERQGIISQANIEAAHALLNKYREADFKLKHNGVCRIK